MGKALMVHYYYIVRVKINNAFDYVIAGAARLVFVSTLLQGWHCCIHLFKRSEMVSFKLDNSRASNRIFRTMCKQTPNDSAILSLAIDLHNIDSPHTVCNT